MRVVHVLVAIVVGLVLAQPARRWREREAADVGETVGRYVVERARLADEQSEEALRIARSSRSWAFIAALASIGALVASVLLGVL